MINEKMEEPTTSLTREFLNQGNTNITNNIKTLIYKENPVLFDLLDFEDDKIYQEPLLFAYFNAKEKVNTLDQLLFGYIIEENRPTNLAVYSDENGRVYLPNFGWLHTNIVSKICNLQIKNSTICLQSNNEKVNYTFEKNNFLTNSSFELVHYQHPLLIPHYYDAKGSVISVEVENVSKNNIEHLNNAIKTLYTVAPDFYAMLSEVLSKMVIFNDATLKRNSFASLSVHGCIFFNSFQKDYNEVFFIEDIAHQGVHVVFNALAASNKELYFKVDSETHLTDKGIIGWMMNRFEKRTLFILMHALHTYYAILICLDAFLDLENINKNKKHEALGRFGYTIGKLKFDLKIIDRKGKDGNNLYLTEKGSELLEMYKTTYSLMLGKRGNEIQSFRFINQPYNFTYSKFVKLNPLKKEVC